MATTYSSAVLVAEPHSMDHYLQGSRGEQGQLSPVRRFFCLFLAFDFFFTCLMWLLCLVISTQPLIIAIGHQVLRYTIYSSLFDLVMVAATRCITLLLMYGLIHINHWWAVALSTLGSSAFLVTKVFLYDWEKSEANSTYAVVMLLCSFVLAWNEVWLIDFRVIPRERQASAIIAKNLQNERTPLLRGYPQSIGERSSYYSPIASPEGSEYENSSTYYEKESYRRLAKEALLIACNSMKSEEWEVESTSEEDIVYSRKIFRDKKIYKFVGTISAAPTVVFEQMYVKFEDAPNWNRSLVECRVLKKIDDATDIVYQVAAEGGGGLVSSRDFITVRTWEKAGDDYISSGISINYAGMPPQKAYVRGENGPSAWFIECIPGEPNMCRFHWLLNTDLKGWIPQYLIDQTLARVMLEFIGYLRKHLSTLHHS